MADILGLANYVQQQGAIGKEAGQKSRLAKLYSAALGAPQDQQAGYVQQMAAESPEAAMQAQGQFSDARKQAHDELGRDVALFVATAESADPATVQQSYAQLVRKAQAMGHPVPPTYDPKMLPMLQKYASVVTGGQQQQLSPHVIGNALVDPTGKVLYQGEAAPSSAQLVSVPDGQGGTVQMMFDPKTRQLSQPQYPGQEQPTDSGVPVQSGAMLDPTQDYPQLAANFPGTQVSSLFRSPSHNAEVGGVPNSQHMKGTAGDFVIPKAEQAAFIAKAKALGYEVIPEGDHVHVELPPGRKAAASFAQGARLGYTPPKAAADGAPSGYQWNADHSSLVPIPGGPADKSAEAQALGDTTKTGPAYLASLPQQTASQVKALAEGRMAFPGGTALKSPYWQAMLSAVSQYDPNFDAVNYNARSKTRSAFTSGKEAQTINALNTVAEHLGTFSDNAANLHNTGFPMFNRLKNKVLEETGDQRIAAFNTNKKAVADEIAKVWRASGGSEADIQENLRNLDGAQSPEQLNAAIGTLTQLIYGKISALKDQYESGMGTSQTPRPLVSKDAQRAFDKTLHRMNGTESAPSKGGWGIQKVGN